MKKLIGVRSSRHGLATPDIRQITFGIQRNGGVDYVFRDGSDAQVVVAGAGVNFCNAQNCVLYCRNRDLDGKAVIEQGDCTGAQVVGREPRLSVMAEVNAGNYGRFNLPCKR